MKKVLTILLFLAATGMSFAQNGLNFDGSNDYVQTSYQGVIGSSNRTFEAWINIPASAPATNLAILDYGANLAGSRNTFVVAGNRSLGSLSGGTKANIFSTPRRCPGKSVGACALRAGQWTRFVFVNGVRLEPGICQW